MNFTTNIHVQEIKTLTEKNVVRDFLHRNLNEISYWTMLLLQ